MSRTIILIRHAQSTGGRFDRYLFPKEGAPLSEQGVIDAKHLNAELRSKKIDLNQAAAVSELIRTKQTAIAAGFDQVKVYDTLNEVNTGLPVTQLELLIKNNQVPKNAITAAKKLLKNPPAENVWVTHGLLIAGIGHVLNISVEELYIPDMATISMISID